MELADAIYEIEDFDRRVMAPLFLLYLRLKRRADGRLREKLDRLMDDAIMARRHPCNVLREMCHIAHRIGVDAKICREPPEHCKSREHGL
ncbi:hypothetical protein Pyrfu_1168 [Pyrolobus fumarii 1A]|uniref:Uncharacterized protein n=1 Tax=Pyrolobus fumarii (strain DSM 11204 / 1A) TaxID=694429 RepID=G0EFK7_PYRF1|nr:hypothetical protein [Pyrolobus fumarii]AEM39031.1 hypothetical protein Pyrfu_1168 [Pyrolobus fumarii 1A]